MKNVFIAAGGTGGHINAALSLGDDLSKKYNIIYFTGQRHLDYKLYNSKNVIHLMSRPLRSLNPVKFCINLILNLYAFFMIIFYLLRFRPLFIVGAGGYICGPVLLGGYFFMRRIFVIEQNAVAGLTNKILAKISDKVFTSFDKVKGMESLDKKKIFNLGNPIRKEIKYKENKVSDKIHILVFGGSLGATQINNAIHELILTVDKSKYYFVHQVGKDNLNKDFEGLEHYRQCEYIDNMSEAYDQANIIVSRAGASTISELRVVKKPSILIPFPAAVDNHQFYNAQELKDEKKFYVNIIDHKQEDKMVSKDILRALEEIEKENSYFAADDNVIDSSKEIIKEIEKCLE